MVVFTHIALATTAAISLCNPLITHYVRSIRREIEDYHDYRRLRRGRNINPYREKERLKIARSRRNQRRMMERQLGLDGAGDDHDDGDHHAGGRGGSVTSWQRGDGTFWEVRRGYTSAARRHVNERRWRRRRERLWREMETMRDEEREHTHSRGRGRGESRRPRGGETLQLRVSREARQAGGGEGVSSEGSGEARPAREDEALNPEEPRRPRSIRSEDRSRSRDEWPLSVSLGQRTDSWQVRAAIRVALGRIKRGEGESGCARWKELRDLIIAWKEVRRGRQTSVSCMLMLKKRSRLTMKQNRHTWEETFVPTR